MSQTELWRKKSPSSPAPGAGLAGRRPWRWRRRGGRRSGRRALDAHHRGGGRRGAPRGGQALAIPTDVSDPNGVDLLVRQTLRASGRIDLLINNAGVLAPIGRAWEVPPLIWQRNVLVNLSGVFLCANAVLPHMINQEPLGGLRGKIVNISSGAANYVVPGWSAYSAAKAGVDQFTRVLAAEVEPHAITVNSAYPGVVDTQMQAEIRRTDPERFPERPRFERYYQMGQLRPPEEVARFLLWLCSPFTDALTGQIVRIDDEAIRQRVAQDLGEESLPERKR